MNEIVGPLSVALLHFLWQGVAIALVLALALRLVRLGNVQARYALCVAALGLMAVAPPATLVYLQGNDATSRPSPATNTGSSTTTLSIAPTGSEPGAAVVPPRIEPTRLSEALHAGTVALWLIGVLVFTALNTGGWLQVRRLRGSGVPVEDPSWGPWIAELRQRLGIDHLVPVLRSDDVDVPTVLGWVRPAVLVPTSAILGMSPRLLEALLLHELAHVRRHDAVVNLLQAGVETLLFYHPAVWWVSRQVRHEREHCCDELAVRHCGSRQDYVQALADMETIRLATPRLAVAADGGSLVERIRRLTGSNTQRNGGSTRWAFGAWIIVLSLTIGAMQLVSFPSANASPAPQDDPDPSATSRSSSRADATLEAIEGSWWGETRRDRVHLELRLDGKRRYNGSFTILASELTGTGADGIPGFQLRRDAGTFYFEGKLDGRDREQRFEFRGNPEFVDRMASIGFEVRSSERRLFEMAALDVSLAFAEGIRDAGYGDISTNRLVEFRIHGVTPTFISEMADVGFEKLSPSRLVEFRIHGVSPEFVREMAEIGFDGLTASRLVEFRIHGVTPEFVSEMEASGFDGLTASRLVEFRIHGVTPEFVREIRSAGIEDVTASRLVEFRIHGVSAQFVEEMAALGIDDLSASRLVEFRIHGVSPDFVRKAQSKYGHDLTSRDLVEMRIHGSSYDVE